MFPIARRIAVMTASVSILPILLMACTPSQEDTSPVQEEGTEAAAPGDAEKRTSSRRAQDTEEGLSLEQFYAEAGSSGELEANDEDDEDSAPVQNTMEAPHSPARAGKPVSPRIPEPQ